VNSSVRLLIIDDYFDEDPLLRRLLEEDGFSLEVMTGRIFPVSTRTFDDYHAVIVDGLVAQPNGFDWLCSIRNVTQIPVLVLTSRGATQDRIAAFKLGADAYVVKPCRPREVVARVRALLRRRLVY